MDAVGLREVKSFCRICTGGCGMRLTIDGNDPITALPRMSAIPVNLERTNAAVSA